MILNSIETNNTFMGAIAENFVAQSFIANSIPLFYWKSEDTAEIDFVIQQVENGIKSIPFYAVHCI